MFCHFKSAQGFELFVARHSWRFDKTNALAHWSIQGWACQFLRQLHLLLLRNNRPSFSMLIFSLLQNWNLRFLLNSLGHDLLGMGCLKPILCLTFFFLVVLGSAASKVRSWWFVMKFWMWLHIPRVLSKRNFRRRTSLLCHVCWYHHLRGLWRSIGSILEEFFL